MVFRSRSARILAACRHCQQWSSVLLIHQMHTHQASVVYSEQPFQVFVTDRQIDLLPRRINAAVPNAVLMSLLTHY